MRPLFDNILGQDKVIKALRHEIQKERLQGTFLFSGPSSVGKKLTAITAIQAILAKSDGATHAKENALRKITANTHPDYLFLTPKENSFITIDEAQAVIKHLRYTPLEASHRFVVINNADMLNLHAANSLLKTLEEPPKHAVIFLLTARPSHLPDTIVSRCRQFLFQPLQPVDQAKILQLTAQQAKLFEFFGDYFTDEAHNTNTVSEKVAQIEEVQKTVLRNLDDMFLKTPNRINLDALWGFGAKAVEEKKASQSLMLLHSLLNDIYLLNSNISADQLLHSDSIDTLAQLREKLKMTQLEHFLYELSKIIQAVRFRNANAKIAVETALHGMEMLA